MVTGYTKLGQFMVDQDYAIFRKFQHLAARDLLYLQAELVQLELEHQALAQTDRESRDQRQFYDQEWWHLSNSEVRGLGGAQWATSLKIREKLREYYGCVSQYSEIAAKSEPRIFELDLLRTWIANSYLGGGCDFLGKDLGGFVQPSVYHDMHRDDLMLLNNKRGEDDILTRFLSGPVLKAFHCCFWRFFKKPVPLDQSNPTQPGGQSGLHHYRDSHVLGVINVLGTVVSSLAPMFSIIALSFVTGMPARLGLVSAFTVVFAASLAVATKARRIEIFAATAAFASVQVVFVGSTNRVGL